MSPAFRYAIVLDFEATCDEPEPLRPQEIIEFPSVLLDLETLEVVDAFESFVRPSHHPTLTSFCRQLTTIRQADVDTAPTFPTVFASHQAWLASHALDEQNAVFVTCGDWDLRRMLPDQAATCAPPLTDAPALYYRWHNVKRSFAKTTGRRPTGMVGMLAALGLELEGTHHRGIDDCRNLARLVVELVARGAVIAPTREVKRW